MSDESEGIDPDLLRKIERSVRRLPLRRRNIFLLACVKSWTYAEIANAYGMRVWRVERHLEMALRILVLEVLQDKPQPWWRRWWP